jgi:hypothetical protein
VLLAEYLDFREAKVVRAHRSKTCARNGKSCTLGGGEPLGNGVWESRNAGATPWLAGDLSWEMEFGARRAYSVAMKVGRDDQERQAGLRSHGLSL